MPNEITLKDVYDIVEKKFSSLEAKVEKYHDSFVHFEEGKVSDLIRKTTEMEGEIKNLKEKLLKEESKEDKNKSQIKIWAWGVFEKLLFIVIGFAFTIIGLVLTRLGIINFT